MRGKAAFRLEGKGPEDPKGLYQRRVGKVAAASSERSERACAEAWPVGAGRADGRAEGTGVQRGALGARAGGGCDRFRAGAQAVSSS